jgi:type II secretory pathway component PulM
MLSGSDFTNVSGVKGLQSLKVELPLSVDSLFPRERGVVAGKVAGYLWVIAFVQHRSYKVFGTFF